MSQKSDVLAAIHEMGLRANEKNRRAKEFYLVRIFVVRNLVFHSSLYYMLNSTIIVFILLLDDITT